MTPQTEVPVERIVSAAIKIKDGTVVTGPSHSDAIASAVWHHVSFNGQLTVGFTTSMSRFVDREEAFKIAKAADQLNERAVEGQILLYSQDLKGEK